MAPLKINIITIFIFLCCISKAETIYIEGQVLGKNSELQFSNNYFQNVDDLKHQFENDSNYKRKYYTIILYINGEATPYNCTTYTTISLLNDIKATVICEVPFNLKEIKNLRLEVLSPGFKKYSKNFVEIDNQGPIILKINRILLEETTLPKVSQVIHINSQNGNNNFKIIFHNPYQHEVMIIQTTVLAKIPAIEVENCCCPPNSIFEISETLKINNGDLPKNASNYEIMGSYKDLKLSSSQTIKAKGQIKVNNCFKNQLLEINLPCSILLSPEKYSAIEIIFPKKISITNSFYDDPLVKEKPSKKQIRKGELSRFKNYHFIFQVADKNELPIIATKIID